MAKKTPKAVKPISEGQVEIVNGQYLNYAQLADGSFIIERDSLYDYIGIVASNDEERYQPDASEAYIFYKSETGKTKIGIPVMEVAAVCVAMVQMNIEEQDYGNQARNAAILLMFLATTGLNQLIEEVNAPVMNKLITGLRDIQPFKRNKE